MGRKKRVLKEILWCFLADLEENESRFSCHRFETVSHKRKDEIIHRRAEGSNKVQHFIKRTRTSQPVLDESGKKKVRKLKM